MNDRLQPLCFLPPPTGLPWVGPPSAASQYKVKRAAGSPVTIELPLFWNEPPWYQAERRIADMVATSVASMGILVSALRRDLQDPDEPLTLHQRLAEQPIGGDHGERFLPRVVPYRPERYGLCCEDFDGARIIDVRLTIHRDPTGRFAYRGQQLERWDPTIDHESVSGATLLPDWAAAASFPPDVASLDQLSAKIDQLRVLSPSAAIFVSIAPHRMQIEIPKILAAQPDGLILRLDELPLSGLELGLVTRQARRLLTGAGAAGLPLWLVPGPITADDAVKLIVLGASGLAIDDWCCA